MKTLSIITITYNNPGLQKTLDSVQLQNIDSNKIEHIIIDNLSTDNTPIIIKKYKKSVKYSVIYIREKDTGRYNAMNKGIIHSKGKYLLFLNAGDTIYNKNILSEIFEKNIFNEDIIYGDIMMIKNENQKEQWSLADYKINKQFFIDRTIFHQAAFIKKELFNKYGLYNEKYQIVGDFDFFIKTIIKNNVNIKYLPLIISNYDANGISGQMSDLFLSERTKVILKYYSGKQYFYNLLKHIYYKNKKYFPKILVKLQQQHLSSKPKV